MSRKKSRTIKNKEWARVCSWTTWKRIKRNWLASQEVLSKWMHLGSPCLEDLKNQLKLNLKCLMTQKKCWMECKSSSTRMQHRLSLKTNPYHGWISTQLSLTLKVMRTRFMKGIITRCKANTLKKLALIRRVWKGLKMLLLLPEGNRKPSDKRKQIAFVISHLTKEQPSQQQLNAIKAQT